MICDFKDIIDVDQLYSESYIQNMNLISNSKDGFTVLRYDKNKDISNVGMFRSVIFKDKKLVCFSPPKSVHYDSFKEDNIQFEEFIEGTMINVFYYDKKWNISTRSIFGAETSYYNNLDSSSVTFKDMFEEALIKSNLKLDLLDCKYCYSFVLQHPKNRIVVPLNEIRLYLCGVYRIENTRVFNINIHNNPELELMFRNSTVAIPIIDTNIETIQDAINKYTSTDCPYYIQGIVLKCGTMRSKIRNPKYNHIKLLRGNQAKLQYHYYYLRQNNKINEFLTYFPEYENTFIRIENELYGFVTILYHYYIDCFIRKRKQLDCYPYEYKNHLYQLHGIYINELRKNKRNVTIPIVSKYIYNLEPARLMYSINYNKRVQCK